MSTAFNLLTAGGARFNKSKYKHDIELFSAKSTKKDKGKGKATDEGPSSLPQSLDFFGTHPTAPQPSKQVKRARPTSDSESDSDSDASTSKPAPPVQKITISGPDPLPKSIHTNLPSLLNHSNVPTTPRAGVPLLRALKDSGISSLWGVQTSVAGSLLEGFDTLCVAPTGSGKTLAYVLPILVRLGDPARSLRGKEEGRGIRCLVVVPTYDLGVQIAEVVKAVSKGRAWRCLVLSKATEKAVCEASPGDAANESGSEGEDSEVETGHAGSKDEVDEEEEVEDPKDDEDEDDESTGSVNEFTPKVKGDGPIPLGIDFLISTPERLHHLVESGRVSLAHTKYLVLDESDRLLSPDFLPQTTPIVEACTNASIQKCLLSATMPAGVEELGRAWLKDGGVRVVVGVKDSATTSISQSLLYTSTESGKILALRNLLSTGQLPYPTLLFVQSIDRATQLHSQLLLEDRHLKVGLIHSGLGKTAREETVQSFREGKVWLLVVTEVLARGMDFKGVKVVVNYDFPQTVQSYIHRIGRTGRAGRPGKAITFFGDEDGPYLRTIANVLTASGCPVPPYMLTLQKPSKNLKRQLAKAPVKRKDVGGGGRDLGREEGLRKKGIVEGSIRRGGKSPKNGEKSGDGGKKAKVSAGAVDLDE